MNIKKSLHFCITEKLNTSSIGHNTNLIGQITNLTKTHN